MTCDLCFVSAVSRWLDVVRGSILSQFIRHCMKILYSGLKQMQLKMLARQMETARLIKLEGTFSHHFFSGLEMEEKYAVNTTSQLRNVITASKLMSL